MGVHHDIGWNEYVQLPYMNASTICNAFLSAQHLRCALDGRSESGDSEDRLFGRALHARLLEPDTYSERYVQAGGCCAILKSGARKDKPCGISGSAVVTTEDGEEWRCGKHMPRGTVVPNVNSLVSFDKDGMIKVHDIEVLSPGAKSRVEKAAKAVERDKAVRLLKIAGGFEVTVIWEFQGVKCKSRLDKLCLATEDTPLLIIDLKKVQLGKGTDFECKKSAERYLYDVKAQFYREAVYHATGLWSEFAWVYVEDKEPFGVNLFTMSESDKRVAQRRLGDCWGVYFSSQSSGKWPGYMNGSTKPKVGMLPDWVT